MRLAKLSVYRDLVYEPSSRPCIDTLRRNIRQIPGGRIEGGRYYVDLDAYDRVNRLGDAIQAKLDMMRKDPDLEGLV